jgi:hypothetical protein
MGVFSSKLDRAYSPRFERFPLLPKELRLQIWKNALPDPQVLELVTTGLQRDPSSSTSNHATWRWKGTSALKIPLLGVSQEARTVALESYERLPISKPLDSKYAWPFFDYSRDTFYFSVDNWKEFLEMVDGEYSRDRWTCEKSIPMDMTKVQFLAIGSVASQFRDSGGLIPRFENALLKSQKVESPDNESQRPLHRMYLDEGEREVEPWVYQDWSSMNTRRHFERVFGMFKNLKTFYTTIDERQRTRKSMSSGTDSLLSPVVQQWDPANYLANHQAWIQQIVSTVRPDLHIPKVGLRFMLNEEDTIDLARWDYANTTADLCYAYRLSSIAYTFVPGSDEEEQDELRILQAEFYM